MNEVVKTSEELTYLYAYHHETNLNLVISDSLILNHESLRREARTDFKEMVGFFSQEAIEALRFEFVSCVSQGYALSTISTYILKTIELIRLVKKAGIIAAGPVKTLCAHPQLWKMF